MPTSRGRRVKPPRDDSAREFAEVERVVAGIVPPPRGAIAVLTVPESMDFSRDPEKADFLYRAAARIKELHGFAGVIVMPHGYTLDTFNAEQLAGIGLQVIPHGGGLFTDPEGNLHRTVMQVRDSISNAEAIVHRRDKDGVAFVTPKEFFDARYVPVDGGKAV